MYAAVSPSESAVESVESEKSAKPTVLFSILIPVYNEQAYLALVVEKVLAAPLPTGVDRELILVDDCSTDRTPEAVRKLVEKYPDKIRAFRQLKNQGKGAAIRRAVQEMRGDFAVIQDADLEYDPNEYSLLLAPLLDGRADVVYGSRFARREISKVLLYHHKLGNLFLTHLSNFTTGLDLTDMETCYKAFRGDALKSLPLRSNRFGIEPEITAKIAKRGWTVYEVPISYNGRRYSEGKKIGWKDGVSAIRTIFKYWRIDDSFYESDRDPASQGFVNCRNFARLLVRKALPYLGLRTLEIGAGQGNVTRLLPQKERLTATDSDEKNLKFLRASYEGNAVVDVARLDLAERTSELEDGERDGAQKTTKFDSIVALNRFDRATFDDEKSLRYLRSFLNPGGRLIFCLPKRVKITEKTTSERAKNAVATTYSRTEIARRLVAAGYRIEKIEAFAALETLLRRGDGKAPSRFALKLFDSALNWSKWLDAALPTARFFVVATAPNNGKSSTEG